VEELRRISTLQIVIYKRNLCNISCQMCVGQIYDSIPFNRIKILFTSKLDVNFRKTLLKYYILSIALYGAGTWTLRTEGKKYMEISELLC
jgi:hypothetical protein